MRSLSYLLIGIFFGITLFKSEAASWFRIYEMFAFDAFHMYGIIGTAVALGILMVQAIKRFRLKSFYGEPIVFCPKFKASHDLDPGYGAGGLQVGGSRSRRVSEPQHTL